MIIALDLFAGTGWGVACKRLGIDEKGVELMAEAVATREANGMKTIYRDVWDGLLLSRAEHARLYGIYTMLIASPPCQTFSMAGRGAGRKALDEVIEAIQLHAYKDPAALLAFGEKHDVRTALVLSPLAYIYRDMPQYVALEQVATVLPVWEAYAEVMRDLGYSVKTAVLQSEQYGVPQTRKRAILVARLDGPVSLPTPTHSKYYPNDPEKLDAGVLPWISMKEALGWSGDPETRFTQNNKLAHQARRPLSHPAPTVTAGHDSGNRGFLDAKGALTVATPDQVAALQSYPSEGWGFSNRPAMTVTGHGLVTRSPTGQKQAIVTAAARGEFTFRPPFTAETAMKSDYAARDDGYLSMSEMLHPEAVNCTPEENAALQSYPTMLRSNYGTQGNAQNRGERTIHQPAATLTSKANRNKWDGEKGMEPSEASALQSYEPPFVWCGVRTKQFLQIGNAVPPLMAQAVLAALISPTADAPRRRRTTRKLV